MARSMSRVIFRRIITVRGGPSFSTTQYRSSDRIVFIKKIVDIVVHSTVFAAPDIELPLAGLGILPFEG